MDWITCENTYEEAWRRILEFANIDLAVEAIESVHGIAQDKRTSANYRKQASQIRVSLLQAKEYFDAVKATTLYTKPNHLYYGTIALATACMLIRADGNFSLDILRRDKKNQHHGLDFTFSSDINFASKPFSLLENSFIKICPNGHFGNWFKSLKSKQLEFGIVKNILDNNSYEQNYNVVGEYYLPKYDGLINAKSSILELLKKLPDLNHDLSGYGILSESARGDCEVVINHLKKTNISRFTFHNSPSGEILEKIIRDRFECNEGVMFSYNIASSRTSGIVSTREDKTFNFSFPESRTTLDHKNIYYLEKLNTPEIVDLYLISYGLSMLSRYYPDVWVTFIESHCKGAKLVERLISILISKIPILILNQFTDKQYVISNHRPIWH